MIFNAYQNSDLGIAGISVVSSGHIFAEKGRKINRPEGRSDFLLLYIAKGKETFFQTPKANLSVTQVTGTAE